jgi:hypothetical protein
MTARLISVSQCVAFSGLAADELILGVAPSRLHDRLYKSYLRHRNNAHEPLTDRIVRDIRGCISIGATKPAADLLIVLRRALTQLIQRSDAVRIRPAFAPRSRGMRRSAKRRRNTVAHLQCASSLVGDAVKAGVGTDNVLSLEAYRLRASAQPA